uniref:2,3-bisphosphoglycerate-independent phosphoglycerate mutase n=1 Tax=Plectus sambesii TaxID=2011161 RepID=A0A914UJ64_9BILA
FALWPWIIPGVQRVIRAVSPAPTAPATTRSVTVIQTRSVTATPSTTTTVSTAPVVPVTSSPTPTPAPAPTPAPTPTPTPAPTPAPAPVLAPTLTSVSSPPSTTLVQTNTTTVKKAMSSSKSVEVKQPVCLIVIDGWGISEEKHGNAILNAKTPVMDKLCSGNWTQIEAHGEHVGLPDGLMGNSEVGHLNIGAGRVIYQEIVRINLTIKKGELVKNNALKAAAENAKKGNGRLHLLGLVSDGGVHSHIDHMFALIKAVKELGVPNTFVHFFGDGRDTSPNSGVGFLKQTQDFLKEEKYGKLATMVGRYYAMDRDKRWERIQVAYEALVAGEGEKATEDGVADIIKERYAKDETDEFLKPIVIGDDGRIQDNDTLVFFDYRADRMREIVETFGIERHFKTETKHPSGLNITGMTQYNADFPFPALFPPQSQKNVLAEWLAAQGLSQFHCAETEKYAHVTFFFNGGVEKQFENEERCMVPSPKVATYDLQPEMNAAGVADKMVEQIKAKKHPFIMCNFAPPDMVGHTGVYDAAVKACE